MCDLTQLQMDVEELVRQKLFACEPFTTVDISHPLIKKDPSIRHHEVRAAMNKVLTDSELDAADFQISDVTVYPNGPGTTGRTARLWHPTSYDPQDYKSTSQVLVRGPGGGATIVSTQVPAIIAKSAPKPVVSLNSSSILFSRTCRRQSKNDTLNISTKVIAKAGLRPFDRVQVMPAPASTGCKVVIIPTSSSQKGLQRVDKEGRIRLHGEKARIFSGSATAQVVVEGGKTLIRLT